ncbi:MAG: hypothetical protein AB1611_14175 [bacterium]
MSGKAVLIRCDGSPEIGLGHVVRCLALADELCRVHQLSVAFAMRHSPPTFEMVRRKGYPVLTPQPDKQQLLPPQPDQQQPFDYRRWIEEAIDTVDAGALILDVRDDLPRQVVDIWRRQGILIAVLDDPGERRLAADLAFYPPVPQVQRLDWRGFTGQLQAGWEWVVLRPEFAHPPLSPSRPFHSKPLVLVTMGGSDPAGLTLLAARALDTLAEDFEAVLVPGPAFQQRETLEILLAGARRSFTVQSPGDDLPGLMSQADMAIISFGITAYELAALGVPAIYLCLTGDHAESASSLVAAGFGKSLGVFSQMSQQALADAVREFLTRGASGPPMTSRLIDGRGAERIARRIADRLREHSIYA